MKRFSPAVVREFFMALGRGYTYNIFRNYYAVFGLLWGMPVPVVTLWLGMYFGGMVLSPENVISYVRDYPIYIFFLLHPVLFGVVFGAMGTIREEKEKQRRIFGKGLIEANEKLVSANKRLKELDELKDNFLSMVSHELLSPLTTIQGYVTFISGEKLGRLTDGQKEALGVTCGQIDHLKRLIEDLMDISKIEAGKFEVNIAKTDIKEVIFNVIDGIKRDADEKGVLIEVRLPRVSYNVMADAGRMKQVFSNIIGNAVKFTPRGGTVAVSAAKRNDIMEFCVEDTGIGIRKEDTARIFDKFYQADSTGRRRYGGCGLGLAIARNIVERHGGRIWAESMPGAGTKMFFTVKAV